LSVHVIASASVQYSVSHATVSDAAGISELVYVPIVVNETFFALSLSALSAILIKSLPTTVLFVTNLVGDNWLGVATKKAPVPHVSVSACISPSVAISTTHAAVVLAFGVAVPVSTTSHWFVVKL